MKSVAYTKQAGRSSYASQEMFDGTAARQLGQAPRVIIVDRRAPRASYGDNRMRKAGAVNAQQLSYSFRDDMKFAVRALGFGEMLREARTGSLSGKAIPGATPAAVACAAGFATLFGVIVALL